MTVTISARKAHKIERLRGAGELATAHLRQYAATHGGNFSIFGSFARGEILYSSDFDVMVEFPAHAERAARAEAEAICRHLGLVPDVHLASDSSDALKARVARDAIRLP